LLQQHIIKYNTPATCFGLRWPSWGRWLSKERVPISEHVQI